MYQLSGTIKLIFIKNNNFDLHPLTLITNYVIAGISPETLGLPPSYMLLLGKILEPVGRKYSLSPLKVHVFYISNINTLPEDIYLPFSHLNGGHSNVFQMLAMTYVVTPAYQ